MARIDREAAREEIKKAKECDAQADELVEVAKSLRSTAKAHLREAADLIGSTVSEVSARE